MPRALKLGAQPPKESELNEYGMGLKKAAFWFGKKLTILTKNPSDQKCINGNGYKLVMDLDKFNNNEKNVSLVLTNEYKNIWNLNHGTVIHVENIHDSRDISFSAVYKLKDKIASFYRRDIINNKIKISIIAFFKNKYYDVVASTSLKDKKEYIYNFKNIFENTSFLEFKPAKKWIVTKDSDPKTYDIYGPTDNGYETKVKYEIDLNNKKYYAEGEFFIREKGSWKDAGIDIFRGNRVIDKSKEFIKENSTLPYQRINGFLNLKNFDVTQTKDKIDWEGKLFDLLKQKFDDDSNIKKIIKIANDKRASQKNNDKDIFTVQSEYINSISKDETIKTLSSIETRKIAEKIAKKQNFFEYRPSDCVHIVTKTNGNNIKVYSRVATTNEEILKMNSWLEINDNLIDDSGNKITLVTIDSNKPFFMPFAIMEQKKDAFINILRKFSVYWAIAENENQTEPPFNFSRFRNKLNQLINLNEDKEN